jgi:hypothetical protein
MKQLIIEPYGEIISLSSVAAKVWRIEYHVLFVQCAQVRSTKFYCDSFGVEFFITNHATLRIYQGDINCSDKKNVILCSIHGV